MERQALVLLENGDAEGAITRLREAMDDPGATDGLRQRATQLIVALGADPTPVSEG